MGFLSDCNQGNVEVSQNCIIVCQKYIDGTSRQCAGTFLRKPNLISGLPLEIRRFWIQREVKERFRS
jgi:hypothetical protein